MNHDIDATIAANAEALERRRAEAQYYISCNGLTPQWTGFSPVTEAKKRKKPKMSRARIEAVKKGAAARRAMAGKLTSDVRQ